MRHDILTDESQQRPALSKGRAVEISAVNEITYIILQIDDWYWGLRFVYLLAQHSPSNYEPKFYGKRILYLVDQESNGNINLGFFLVP